MKKYISFFLLSVFMISLPACAQVQPPQKNKKPSARTLAGFSQATFASGCFWCVEAVYESVKGVVEAESGYAGGSSLNPTYEEVSAGKSSHAEAVNVYYDPSVVSYETLLKVYFASQNPTQVNGQGPDKGRQYRSIIFYRNPGEKRQAEQFIKQLNASGRFNGAIAAEVMPLSKFWIAEEYHQDYVYQHPENPYVQHESIPRVKRFQKQYPALIKEGFVY
jgi:peptide-methionine (S)-S-oxide reductase